MDAVEEYEKAEVLLEAGKITIGQFEEMLKPLRDVEPVRRGRWMGVFCSLCGEEALTEWNECGGEYLFSKYCPYCGAKMDKE